MDDVVFQFFIEKNLFSIKCKKRSKQIKKNKRY